MEMEELYRLQNEAKLKLENRQANSKQALQQECAETVADAMNALDSKLQKIMSAKKEAMLSSKAIQKYRQICELFDMLSENGANSEAYIPKQVHASTEDVTS
jgi:hypothetical protein